MKLPLIMDAKKTPNSTLTKLSLIRRKFFELIKLSLMQRNFFFDRISKKCFFDSKKMFSQCTLYYTERNSWCHALERDQCLAVVAVQIVELRNSSNNCSKFTRAAYSNLWRQNTVYFTCGARETQALNSLGLYEEILV